MSSEDRRTLTVGLVGFVVALALILAAWRIVASDLPDFRAGAAVAAPTQSAEPTSSRTPQETFVVPSPPPPTVTATATATAEPVATRAEAPAPTPAPSVAAAPAAAPRATAAPTPARGQPGAQDPQVSRVDLSCSQNGRRVVADISFLSTGPVPVSLTAGSRTETSHGSGAVHMHLSAVSGGDGATCAAVVNGRQVGPVPAGDRR